VPKFVIEREMPGVGTLTPTDYQNASQKSCDVLRVMGPEVQWMESYVTGDKIYCVYYAANEGLIREHAERAGLPANEIHEVKRMIDPSTAEVNAGMA